MIHYIVGIITLGLVVLVLWLIQPYKNWKKNFDARQYEPISITDRKKATRNIEDYSQAVSGLPTPEISLVVPAFN